MGEYVLKNLVEGERLLYTTRLSGLIFVKPILFILVVGIILAIAHVPFWIVICILILLALLFLIPTWLLYNFSEFNRVYLVECSIMELYGLLVLGV